MESKWLMTSEYPEQVERPNVGSGAKIGDAQARSATLLEGF